MHIFYFLHQNSEKQIYQGGSYRRTPRIIDPEQGIGLAPVESRPDRQRS